MGQQGSSYWLDHNGIETLLIGLTDGELAWDETIGDFGRVERTPLPPVLVGRFPAEPKWVDLRAYREGANPRNAKFIEVGADFAAAVRGMPKEDLLSQEVRQQRRALMLAWSAAASLLILVALAGWQWYEATLQRHEAVAQRDRAEQTLSAATQTANSLVVDLAVRFRDAAGVPLSLVQDIIGRARELQGQLVGAGEMPWQLRLSQVLSLWASADTLLSLGDPDGALAAARDARAIVQTLPWSFPTDEVRRSTQGTLASVDMLIGNCFKQQGKLDEALAAYREANASAKALAAKDADNVSLQSAIAISASGIADVLKAQGKLDDALIAERESVATQRALAAKETSAFEPIRRRIEQQNNVPIHLKNWADVFLKQGDEASQAAAEPQRNLTIYLEKTGDVLLKQGKLDEALAAYQESLAIRKAQAARDANNTWWQAAVSVGEWKVGEVLRARGDLDGALAAYRDNRAIMAGLVARDASNTLWQLQLSYFDDRIGGILRAQGKPDEALAAYKNSLSIRQALVAKDASIAEWHSGLSVSYWEIGNVLLNQSKPEEALASYRAGLAVITTLIAKGGNNSEWQDLLSLIHLKIGDALAAQNKLDEALAAYQTALAIRQRLLAADPASAQWQREVSVAQNKLGGVLLKQGKLEEALQVYRDNLRIAERLATSDRANTQWQRDLSVSYNKIGDVLKAQGKLDEALASYRAGLAMGQALAASDRNNTLWQRDVAFSHERIGDVLMAQGKLDAAPDALVSYRESIAIVTALIAQDARNVDRQNELRYRAERLGGLAYSLVLARNFATALEVADQAIALAPDLIFIHVNRAHALLFLGRVDEARVLYLQHHGRQKVLDEKSWDTTVLEDFAELRRSGLEHPLMDQIEQLFGAGGMKGTGART